MIIFFFVVLFIVMFAAAAYEFSVILGLFTASAPFVPIPKEVLPEIARALNVKKDGVVYDLGCGDGRVLAACYAAEPGARYIGIEINMFAWFLAKKRFWFLGNPQNVKILRKDFFREDLSSATNIFTYLFPKPMEKLFPKFQKELMPGARLVACDFCLKQKTPTAAVDLHRPKNALAHNLYVYEF